MAQNNLTLTQKALVVGFAGALIGEESYNFDSLLNNIMNEIGISHTDFQKHIEEANAIINLYGINAFSQLKNLSQSDKNAVEKALATAIQSGVNANNPNVVMLYKNAISQFSQNAPIKANIRLDSSVKSITRTAAYHLSSAIQNGMLISGNYEATIYKNRIEFGRCNNPSFQNKTGMVAPNFYIEYGNVIYYFGKNLNCGWLSKQLDYCGTFPPTSPDNEGIFNLIYPRFA